MQMPTAATLLPEPVAANVALAAPDPILGARGAVPYLYEGLSRAQRLCVVFVAVFIVFVNMAFGAHVMYSSAERVPFGEADQKTVAAFSSGIQDPIASAVMRSKSIDAVANMKLISNKQAIVIVAFAGAFSMTAIGLASSRNQEINDEARFGPSCSRVRVLPAVPRGHVRGQHRQALATRAGAQGNADEPRGARFPG